MSTLSFDVLAHGFGLIEGPRYQGGALLFSDVTRGGVYRLTSPGQVETLIPKRRGVGGIAVHADGGVVVSGRNICHVRDGVSTTIFEVPDVGGFNDLYTDTSGRLYVGSLRSDPFGDAAARIPGELYRLNLDGSSERLYGDIGLTNGIGFSPDGGRLYHSDSAAKAIVLHDVDGEGRVSNRRESPKLTKGIPDGLAVDRAGEIWVATYDGGSIDRLDASGVLIDRYEVPSRAVTSLCFGGEDLCDLYVVTADHSDESLEGCVLRTRVEVPGLPAPPARVAIGPR